MGRSFALLALACITLSACASQEQIASRRAEAEQAATAHRETRCSSFGYKRGSSDFNHCLERMYVQDQQQLAAEKAEEVARVQRVGDALQQAGASLSAVGSPPQPVAVDPIRPPVRCSTIGTTTTCY